jgi:myosin-5
LLERSRLTFQPESERNYHIFYQLCAGCPAAERQKLGLEKWDSYHYLRQGNTGTVNGMDDVEEFELTQKGFSTVGIAVESQWEVFKICAALLHIGNIKVKDNGGNASVDASDPALLKACELLSLDAPTFHKWLVKRQIKMRSEVIQKDAKSDEAVSSRDSIAKFIYSMLFDWIVKVVNKKLCPQNSRNTSFIGVLDIYGFEHFQKNSFEQFCINFANEKLQQEFTRHVFKLEQDEYVAEKIQWSFIDFSDNQPCIEMIEGKLGLMDLMDEETRLPSGTDKSLVQKYYNRFAADEHKFFAKPRFGQTEFIIKHYAIDVTYQIDGFLEKNKDTVTDEQLEMLMDTKFEFLKEVISIDPSGADNGPSKPGKSAPKKPTLGSIFKNSLIQLMETLRQTNPHYIRCIKPNQAKVAFEYEAQNVLAQLIACGVLETIKISRAGYPSKQIYSEFVSRYYLLVGSSEWKTDPKSLTEKICTAHLKKGKYELGLTKVFFRAGQMALLEKVRAEVLLKTVLFMQKNMRRGYRVRQYKKMKGAIKLLQNTFRKHQKKALAKANRKEWAALTIQKNLKMGMARKKYKKTVRAIKHIQGAYRKWAHKRDFAMNEEGLAGAKIWATWKMFLQRAEYKQDLQNIIIVQSLARRKIAMKHYKEMLADYRFNNLRDENGMLVNKLGEVNARASTLAEANFALESKVFDLSISLEAKKKDTEEMQKQCTALGEQLSSMRAKFKKLDTLTKNKNSESAKQISDLRKSMSDMQDTNARMKKEMDKLNGMIRKRDEYILQLQHYKTQKDAEVRLLREQLEKGPQVNNDKSAALKGDINSLRNQMEMILKTKYQQERQNEQFFNPNGLQSAARMSMSFINTAAGVASGVASNVATATLGRSIYETAEYKPLRPLRILPVRDDNTPKDRPVRMLEAEELQDEVVDDLIFNLQIPLPSAQKAASRQEIFFPAHLIGYLISEMLQRGMVDRIREVLGNVTRAIQHLTMKFEDDYISAFWLSNNYELMSIIKPMRAHLPSPTHSSQDDEHSASAVLATTQNELGQVFDDILQGWMREFKKKLSNMIVPAVIENQSLPGYICNQNAGLWSQWTSQVTSTTFTINQLLNFLNKLCKTLSSYYVPEAIANQILTELIRFIGVSAFNHLLVRKNFCTWKRGTRKLI